MTDDANSKVVDFQPRGMWAAEAEQRLTHALAKALVDNHNWDQLKAQQFAAAYLSGEDNREREADGILRREELSTVMAVMNLDTETGRKRAEMGLRTIINAAKPV